VLPEAESETAWRLWDVAALGISSVITYAEARAALAAAYRRRDIGARFLRAAVRRFEATWDQMRLIEVDEPLARLAGQLAESHALRGYDAMHLAAALSLRDERLVIATWDRELAAAAADAGCATVPRR